MSAENAAEATLGREAVLREVAELSIEYSKGINDRRVAPASEDLAGLDAFHEAFPTDGCEPMKVIAELDRYGAPATVATTGGRYFGFVIGGTLPAALGASWLANTWDQNAAYRVMSPVAAELEDVALKWVCEVFGLPEDCGGGLVTCATTANFSGLAAARHALLEKQGWNVEEDGMSGAPPIEVIVGEEVHASVLKALGMAGLGRKRVTVVEADEQGRMRADKLPRLSEKSLVCIQAGNVNTGAFDPIAEKYKVITSGPDGRFGRTKGLPGAGDEAERGPVEGGILRLRRFAGRIGQCPTHGLRNGQPEARQHRAGIRERGRVGHRGPRTDHRRVVARDVRNRKRHHARRMG